MKSITLTIIIMASMVSLAAFAGCGDTATEAVVPETTAATADADAGTAREDTGAEPPSLEYFIAIHCEPLHDNPNRDQQLAENYQTLKEMIAAADAYDIRLTLMFTPQWADYIVADPARQADLESWRDAGHEISAHHHGIYHGNWDGYSDYPAETYNEMRYINTRNPESFLGTLDDYTEALRQINPGIQSGCLNEELDKGELPDDFIYGSCAGYLNNGAPGVINERGNGNDPASEGWNEFIVVGEWDGIERRWLSHFPITTGKNEQDAESFMASLDSGVYGAVTHAVADQAIHFYAFLEYLHEIDPGGNGSVTLTGAIEDSGLPEERVEIVQFARGDPSESSQGNRGAARNKNPAGPPPAPRPPRPQM